jgi:hypothetical protein
MSLNRLEVYEFKCVTQTNQLRFFTEKASNLLYLLQ